MIKKRIFNFILLNRKCVICIDEMSLKANLYYNINRNEIIGFQDLKQEKKPFSQNAIIFDKYNYDKRDL